MLIAYSFWINQIKIGETGYPFMIDQNGLAQVHPQKEMVAQVNMAEIKEMQNVTRRMLDGETGTDFLHIMVKIKLPDLRRSQPPDGVSVPASQTVKL